MSVTFRCRSGDGDTIIVCEDVNDGSPALLVYRKTGLAAYLMLTRDDAQNIADALLKIIEGNKPDAMEIPSDTGSETRGNRG